MNKASLPQVEWCLNTAKVREAWHQHSIFLSKSRQELIHVIATQARSYDDAL